MSADQMSHVANRTVDFTYPLASLILYCIAHLLLRRQKLD